ncbi:MAG: chromate transporter [Spirochaetaceae bacterium]|jgi:chromate transporter|nr:chromate transporter [Spirochaetaceae bacterium]
MAGYIDLFAAFLKIGCVTFGGGYAMIPVIERELIKKKGWATLEEVMDYYTIAQVTPGIIAVNVSTFIGFKQKGPLGGVVSTVGFALPGVSFISVIALCLRNFAAEPAVQHAFTGIRIAVGALIIDTAVKLLKGLFKDGKAALIFALSFGLSAVLSANPVLLVTGAGIAGFLLYRPSSKAAGKKQENLR